MQSCAHSDAYMELVPWLIEDRQAMREKPSGTVGVKGDPRDPALCILNVASRQHNVAEHNSLSVKSVVTVNVRQTYMFV